LKLLGKDINTINSQPIKIKINNFTCQEQ